LEPSRLAGLNVPLRLALIDPVEEVGHARSCCCCYSAGCWNAGFGR
jgi:hypothetical protein